MVAVVVLLGVVIIRWYRKRRRRRLDRAAAEQERRAWEGHRLDPAEEFLVKRRFYRWDFWLKKIAYFDKRRR